MAAAVIEFDSLPDAVRSTAENHDFGAGLYVGFVFVLIGGVKIRCEGFEFRRAGVHAFENRSDAITRALEANRCWSAFPDLRELLVARAVALHFAQKIFRSGFYRDGGGAAVHGHDL